jgi:hypothetical protein
VSVVCCQVEFSGTDWSLVQRSPTECGASGCHREASTMRTPRSTRGCCAIGRINQQLQNISTILISEDMYAR